jgi:hypothetical protein
MLNTHLIQVALTAFGISVAAAFAIALTIIAAGALRGHAAGARSRRLASVTPATTAKESAPRREPALR